MFSTTIIFIDVLNKNYRIWREYVCVNIIEYLSILDIKSSTLFEIFTGEGMKGEVKEESVETEKGGSQQG